MTVEQCEQLQWIKWKSGIGFPKVEVNKTLKSEIIGDPAQVSDSSGVSCYSHLLLLTKLFHLQFQRYSIKPKACRGVLMAAVEEYRESK